MVYSSLTPQQLSQLRVRLDGEFEEFVKRGIKLDMSRGKPAPEMLTLANPMLSAIDENSDLRAEDGMDARNYGGLDGIPEAKRLFGEVMGVKPESLIVYGNSSLNLMYDTLVRSMIFGAVANGLPLYECDGRKWLCPVPGYDRHFAITQQLGFEMVNVAMTPDGPDMDAVESLVADPDVKGIWCVPMYSNPTGTVYSEQTIRRLAALKPAAKDFKIYCDNAYIVHHFYGAPAVPQLNMLAAAQEYGNENMVYMFASTSKVSFAGGGVSCIASGDDSIAYYKKLLSYQTIGHDKLNQLRHARYFKNAEGVAQHMKKYMSLLVPKFEAVLSVLRAELGDTGIAEWSEPRGGYFISVNLLSGCAKRTVQLCAEAGLKLTGAGATFPYGRDPQDSNVRIAPSYPTVEQLTVAAKIFCAAAKLAAVEKLSAK